MTTGEDYWVTGDTEDPVADPVRTRVPNLPRRASVSQTPCERRDHAVHTLGRLEGHGTAILARVLAVERSDEELVEQIRGQDSLWYRVRRHAGVSVVANTLWTLRLYHTVAPVPPPRPRLHE